MAFTGNEDHSITLTQAAAMTKNYRATITTGQTIAHYFGKTAIQAILDQSECVGLRLYYGIDALDKEHLIAVGVDASENDLYNGLLAERTIQCPQHCSSANPLNTNVTS